MLELNFDEPATGETPPEVDEQPAKRKTTVPMNENGLPVLGVHEGVLFEDYVRAPGINKSGLDNIDIAPAVYDFERNHPAKDTTATAVGHAFHTLVLEPEQFDKYYVRSEYPEFRTAEAKEWRAEQIKAGLTILRINTEDPVRKPSEWDLVHRMAEAVWKNPVAAALMEGARKEITMFWIDRETGCLCKGRADVDSDAHEVLCDVKTTEDATYSGFARSVDKFRYDVQDVFYTDGKRACGDPCKGFVFIAIEKKPPYLCACYMITKEWRTKARMVYQRNMETYKACKDSGEWPGLPANRDLEMPTYAKYGRIS